MENLKVRELIEICEELGLTLGQPSTSLAAKDRQKRRAKLVDSSWRQAGEAGILPEEVDLFTERSQEPSVRRALEDADCSGGQRCVEHFNMSVNANCDSYKYCIDVSDTSCSCYGGYSCRLKDCPSSPYECLFLEDTNHRCGAPNCYGGYSCRLKDCPSSPYECLFLEDHNHRCGAPKRLKQSDQFPACGPNSIATLYGTEYSCEGCRSASSVLVAPN
ncbi:hypothetical protein HPB50_010639 [Hyalomma asiaticum]|uniref:Uncharacterized protein n=1 Tax=Hyalomma asiaticum TaxID=266040 RepID=A0ACB7RVJ6_HYAAI|nr:hypothetical protein HPB50_010639 [Hyalomma asiaticum]